MKKHFPVFFAVVSLISGAVVFADHQKGDHHNWPCADDVKKFCGDMKKGEHGHGEIMKCLDEHQDKLSDKCKAGREKMKAMMQEFNDACKSDMDSLCKDVKADDHRGMHECLEKNEAKLSAKCKAERAKMKKKWKEHAHDHEGEHSDKE